MNGQAGQSLSLLLPAHYSLPCRATSEDQMDNSGWRWGRFDFKALFETFESIPEPFAPAQDDRHEDDVHVVD